MLDRTLIDARLTREPSTGPVAERNVLAEVVDQHTIDVPSAQESHLFLMDRGYRSADLFNKLHRAGHDSICRLNRTDGRAVTTPVTDARGQVLKPPALTEAAQQAGVIADAFITLGGKCGASKIQSDHPLRRITLLSREDRPRAARQGEVVGCMKRSEMHQRTQRCSLAESQRALRKVVSGISRSHNLLGNACPPHFVSHHRRFSLVPKLRLGTHLRETPFRMMNAFANIDRRQSRRLGIS